MRFGILFIVICVAISPRAFGQEKQERDPGQQPQRQPPFERPTLGPRPTPSTQGPSSSTTTDPAKLMRVRTIFVERIDNLLSEKVSEGITKQGKFRVVANRNEADAVVSGSCSDLRRLKSVHSEIYLNDRVSGAAIWQDSLRHAYNPPPLGQVVNATASEFLAHLEESIKEAQRK